MFDREESVVYDRQIRLWGINAQIKIKKSKVLILGFTGLASELVKTLTLAGVNSITIVDNNPIQDKDPSANLFCRSATTDGFRTSAITSKLNTLNPLVKIHIDNSDFTEKPASFYKGFHLVSLHSLTTKDNISKINNICRSLNILFYLSFDFGFYGAAFSDLGDNYTYSVEEKIKSTSDEEQERPSKRPRMEDVADSNVVEKKMEFVSFETMLSQVEHIKNPVLNVLHIVLEFYSKFGREPSDGDTNLLSELKLADTISIPDWKENIRGSLSPVCAIIGGVIGQDIIRTLSGRDPPICNLFLFDGVNMNGKIERVGLGKNKQKSIPLDEIDID